MRPILALALTATVATAAVQAHADSRIREIAYDPDAVVRLDGCVGFQTTVEFGPEERIENVGLGDASQWLVVPNKRANMLFMKPAQRAGHSNMTVSTSRHQYAFELFSKDAAACQRGSTVYALRFTYPNDPASDPAALTPANELGQRNSAYTFSGARENVPTRVFDNGRQTFFRWSEGAATPAVYAMTSDKSETLVSFTNKGDYLVADQVAPAFVLRRGSAVAVLYNDAYQGPTFDAASPQPREKSGRVSLFARRKSAQ